MSSGADTPSASNSVAGDDTADASPVEAFGGIARPSPPTPAVVAAAVKHALRELPQQQPEQQPTLSGPASTTDKAEGNNNNNTKSESQQQQHPPAYSGSVELSGTYSLSPDLAGGLIVPAQPISVEGSFEGLVTSQPESPEICFRGTLHAEVVADGIKSASAVTGATTGLKVGGRTTAASFPTHGTTAHPLTDQTLNMLASSQAAMPGGKGPTTDGAIRHAYPTADVAGRDSLTSFGGKGTAQQQLQQHHHEQQQKQRIARNTTATTPEGSEWPPSSSVVRSVSSTQHKYKAAGSTSRLEHTDTTAASTPHMLHHRPHVLGSDRTGGRSASPAVTRMESVPHTAIAAAGGGGGGRLSTIPRSSTRSLTPATPLVSYYPSAAAATAQPTLLGGGGGGTTTTRHPLSRSATASRRTFPVVPPATHTRTQTTPDLSNIHRTGSAPIVRNASSGPADVPGGQIISEKVIEHEVVVPKKVFVEEVVEKTIVIPEKRIREEFTEDVETIRKKVVEVAKPIVQEKIVEVPHYEYVEKIIEEKELIIQEKIREVPKISYHERVVEVPKIIQQEKIVEVPQIEYNEFPVEKVVEVPEVREQVVIKEVPVPQYVEKAVPEYVDVQEVHDVVRHYPVPLELVTHVEFKLPKIRQHWKSVAVPLYVPRFVEIAVPRDLADPAPLLIAEEYVKKVSLLGSIHAVSLCDFESLAKDVKAANFQDSFRHTDAKRVLTENMEIHKQIGSF